MEDGPLVGMPGALVCGPKSLAVKVRSVSWFWVPLRTGLLSMTVDAALAIGVATIVATADWKVLVVALANWEVMFIGAPER